MIFFLVSILIFVFSLFVFSEYQVPDFPEQQMVVKKDKRKSANDVLYLLPFYSNTSFLYPKQYANPLIVRCYTA